MHTFCQIIHKITSFTDELYNYSTDPSVNINIDFIKFAWRSSEYKANNKLSYEEDISLRLIKTFMHMFVGSYHAYSIKSKFSYFKKTIDNIFLNKNTVEKFITIFCNIQRAYWILNRAAFRYKWKKAKIQIKYDLVLNPISESQYNVIVILQNNYKYLFTISDLKRIIDGALSNSHCMFANPTAPKNPYNNMPFDKGILYTIYSFMKRGDFVLPILFHNYFLCNFNLSVFRKKNEVIIRNKEIDNYIKNESVNKLYSTGIQILKMNKYTDKIKIHKDFPKKDFVRIILPYIRIYYSYIFTLDISMRNSSENELNLKLKQFYFFNPKFGRKHVETKNSRIVKVNFNDKHIDFSNKNSIDYNVSHLVLEDDDYDDTTILDNIVNDRSINDYELENSTYEEMIQDDH